MTNRSDTITGKELPVTGETASARGVASSQQDGHSIVDSLFALPEDATEGADELGRARIDRLQKDLARRMRATLAGKAPDKSEDAA